MKPRLLNLESVTAAIKPMLSKYLEEHGIDPSKNFSCLNPKHKDENPSMSCKQHPERAFCFGCGFAADIFTAANCLEGRQITGKGFIEDNVLYLAKKYGIHVELEDLTQEEIYEYKTYQAYKIAAELISDPEFGDYSIVDKEIERRGWDKNKIASWGIGTVNSDEYRERMRKLGFEPGFLQGIDLDTANLFSNYNLLFTVYDDQGRPVGFSAKNLRHNGDKNKGPRYINTRATGLECAIFKKGERLYGFDVAKDAPGPLYIFEGQADVVTARHHGLMNCCCTMGTALTDHHITLLKKYGMFNIVMVFDSDESGNLAVEKALDEKFSKDKNFRVKLCQLPAGQDPDELLRINGFDQFVRLKKWTAFQWRMMQFLEKVGEEPDEEQRREIAEKMIPIIVSERSHIRQEEMAKQVAKTTGYELSSILSEIKRQRNEKEEQIQNKKRAAIEATLSQLKYHPEDAELLVAQCQTTLEDINKSISADSEGRAALTNVLSVKEFDEAKTGDFAGYYMKPEGLGSIAARFNEDWKSDCLMFIGGNSQAGKTTFCAQMAYEIANDPRNNAICIYHSIDDSAKFIIYKWVCNATDDLVLKINHVSNPNFWSKQEGLQGINLLREQGYKKLVKLISDEKLVIRDSTNGSSISAAERTVKYFRERYPEKNIVLFIDNFHKLPDYQNIQGPDRTKRLSNHLKELAVVKRVTIIPTVEYRKLKDGERPTNATIAQSASIEYDASAILHLYNDLHIKQEEAELIHIDNEGNLLPRIGCRISKNKICGWIGKEFLDLFPFNGQFRSIDQSRVAEELRARKEFLAENKPIGKF